MGEIQKVEMGYVIPSDITEEEHRALCHEVTVCHEKAQKAVEICQFQIGDLYNSIKWGSKKAYVEENMPGVSYSYARDCGSVAWAARLNVGLQRHLGSAEESTTYDENARVVSGEHDDVNSKTGEPIQQTSVRSDKIPFTLYMEANRGTTGNQFNELIKWAIAGIETPPRGERRSPTAKEMRAKRREITGWVAPLKITIDNEAEFERALDALPKATSKAAKKEFKRILNVLRKDYESDVEKGVSDRLGAEQDRLSKAFADAEAKRKRYEVLSANIAQIITVPEYKLVVNCLHPDKHKGVEERFKRALEIVLRLKQYVYQNDAA